MSEHDESRAVLRALLSEQRLAVLATQAGGRPYASLVAFAASPDLGTLVFATTRATRKYANLRDDPHVALLVDSRNVGDIDFHHAAAVTATGLVWELQEGDRAEAERLLLAKHPVLTGFVASPTCALLRLTVETYYLVSRFQNVVEFHMAASD
jgi:nitroimidazol reductase NimA-like FMN-containing flavoprotein (pyridoxamine 5'-phosphate oxidase superfamily)